MRSKRLFAMLLAVIMVLSVLSPAAMAAENGKTVYTVQPKANSTNTNASSKENDLLYSGGDQTQNEILNLRDDPMTTPETSTTTNTEGSWQFEATTNPGTSLTAETSACLEELKLAENYFNADDVVRAFVVMEDAPLADSYTSISLVSASAQKLLLDKQDSVISAIEKKVLNGQKLEVRYQFTYLTNAISIEVAFGKLQEIAVLSGVKDVVIMSTWNAVPTEESDPLTAASGVMSGVDTTWTQLGYTGESMKIAIIDTGLDLDHPSFAAAPAGADMDVADIEAVLENLNAYKRYEKMGKTLEADDLYVSEKIPYAYNYCDDNLKTDHSRDNQGDHGTHVAGIAAANKTEGTTVVGMAPDAQVIVMKVFGANGGAYTDDFVAAIEDAMTLGCDVVNLSLGSPAGFSESGYETVDGVLVDEIFARLGNQDIIATISAGNETNSSYANTWGTNDNRVQNPENGVVGSPSSYINSFSIASADNAAVMSSYVEMADGTQIFYQPDIAYLYGYDYYGIGVYAGETLEYVIVDGLGEPEDFYDDDGNSLVEGKIAVVKRGSLAFGEKAQNAADAGALFCVIWNTNDEDDIFSFGMNTNLSGDEENPEYPDIPSILMTLSDGQKLADAEVKTLYIAEEMGVRMTNGGGQISSFSSWGTTSDLRLVPDITGIGGNVYSTLDGGTYGVMSGTSMSAPQVAGISALVMQALKEKYPNAADGEIREMALALMMSTANVIIYEDSGIPTSPRQQGAGLVNAAEAIQSKAYLTVNGERPKAELGDSADGVYSFSFEIHNVSSESVTYTLSSVLMSEALYSQYGEIFMAGYDWKVEGDVTFSQNTVTVAAGQTATVSVSIALAQDEKDFIDYYCENGSYVEGYIYLTEAGAEEASLNLPFMGFYGDWTDAPVFDTAYWYDNSFWGVNYATGLPEGDEYYHVFWTSLMGQDWVLGMNPYSGAMVDEDGNIIYDSSNNVVSPNGDGVLDGVNEIYLSLLRNAKTLTFTYTVDGEVVYEEVAVNNPKTMYISSYGQIIPWIGSWYLDSFYFYGEQYDWTDAEGNPLPSGTEVLLTIEAKIDYADGGENVMEIPFVVDTTAPELLEVAQQQYNGMNLLGLAVTDNHNIASVVILNSAGTQIYAQAFDTDSQDLGGGIDAFYFDVSGYGTEFLVAVCDYAGNESYYTVEYTADPNGNAPDMDTSKLYAYRVNDSIINQYYGYDYQFGWVSMDKSSSDGYVWVEQENSDANEYYALTAAEFVDGKIFAVDAAYNLLVMDPGLWNRQIVVNLGVSALDMAFDDTTDTLYLLAKSGYYAHLYSVDMLTGELTDLKNFGYYTSSPFAMTVADDGTIYAIKYNSSSYYACNLYTIDKDNNYAVTAVTNAAGEKISFVDAAGKNLVPNYAQSMTFSDGVIYWAYFSSTYNGNVADLIAIDVEDDFAWTTTDLATYYSDLGGGTYSDTEMVGLLTLDPTDYEFPASTELEELLVSTDRVVMGVGDSVNVSAYPLPWNYELSGMTWTSSNEAVATVADGKIVGVSGGDAVITVSAEGMSAQINVTVADPDGAFYAYNFYSDNGMGDFVYVDLDEDTRSSLGASPVDFIAGDYNGHDGWFYGYSEAGQMYKLNMETGECEAVGLSTGMMVTDMAYDYTTGYMYALYYNQGYATLAYADMNSGKLVDVAMDYYGSAFTLACDLEGNLYTITADGMLAKITVVTYEDEWSGGTTGDGDTSTTVSYLEYEVLMEDLGYLNYAQSMCYDHANDVIIWVNPENSVIYWVDFNNANPYVYAVADPAGATLIEWLGMFTVPAEIPALNPVAVESVTADDMFMMVGAEKAPSFSILPLNANGYTYTLTSSDEEVVVIENGMLVAVGAGTAEVTLSVVDTVADDTIEVTFTVVTADAADNVFGHILTDIATYGGSYWVELPATDPKNPIPLEGTDYILYSEEYYDGKLYAFGYDGNDWEANFQFMVLDPDTFEVLEMHDMGEGFPFVYDMTYDYNTSTMYCVAGAGSEDSNLYAVNMKTGKLTLVMQTEQFFMSLAAGPDGLYAVEHSLTVGDEWDPWAPVETANAQMYLIDPLTGEVEWIGDTGVVFNSIGSMAYDYDTDYLYWTPLDQNTMTGGLALVDPATGEARIIDTIGAMGAQVSGLYIICDEYPEENPVLADLIVTPSSALVYVGTTTQLDVATMSMNLDAQYTFVSSNPAVATVDENGVITGVAEGSATVTVTASYDGVSLTEECEVVVLDASASFLSYDVTVGGWVAVNRADPTAVTVLTENEDAAAPTALAVVDTTIYGVDEDNNLFVLDTVFYEREVLAVLDSAAMVEEYMTSMGLEEGDYVPEEYGFVVRDMAYDAANDRMLVLGTVYDLAYGELQGGSSIYELDLTTGELTNLYPIYTHDTVMGMTVDAEGTVYYYNAFNDFYTALNLETLEETDIVYLGSLSVYGSYEDDHELFYDELTGKIYHLFTSTGNAYALYELDPVTGSVSKVSDVGEVYYDEDLWSDVGNYFSGLVYVPGVELEPLNPFEDVVEEAYFYDAVVWAVKNGITTGTSDDTFDPEAVCDREMIVTFLWRAAGCPEPTSTENPFTDVTESSYAYKAVLWAVENGITNGISATEFGLHMPCAREMVVTLLWRAAGKPEPVTTENPFTDVAEDAYYYKAVLWAVENGITTGYGNGLFGPTDTCTRGMIVTFLYRAQD